MKELRIGFYKQETTGNFTTHRAGLTEEHVEMLQSLKPGDRLIVYVNKSKRSETSFDANLKQLGVYQKNNQEG